MKALLISLVILVGCDPCEYCAITKEEACAEQAEIWCERVGYATSGCWVNYRQWCVPDKTPESLIRCEVQEICLDDLIATNTPNNIPESCLAIWSD